ncbi:hypothetical protein JOC75_000313 [Metabacillus crassostreae]|nr:hypothetical protein [Metabacillus crassostreae]
MIENVTLFDYNRLKATKSLLLKNAQVCKRISYCNI